MSDAGGLFDDWSRRGLVHQTTATGVEEALAKPLTAYIGFDPTAPSLHVGSLLQIVLLQRLQRAGHRPIALLGGGTGMVGDPSGRDDERQLLDDEALAANTEGIREQLERFLDFSGERGAVMIDNAEWLRKLQVIDFLRDIGKHFSVNSMIARESVKRRLAERDHGISYTEFSYSLLQAYDFLELYDRYGCTLQLGGSDQWGNIVVGADLVRRLRGAEVHGLTTPLITRSDGKKFGKSERGNVWLDAERTTPFEFYQYWINTPDDDVVPLLSYFTFLTPEAIEEIEREHQRRPERREAQRLLAEAITDSVHGEEALRRAAHTTRVLFGDGDLTELDAASLRDAFASAPVTVVSRGELERGLPLLDALVRAGLAASKGRARQDVTSGAVSVNHQRHTEPRQSLTLADAIGGELVVLRRGKKTYHLLAVEPA